MKYALIAGTVAVLVAFGGFLVKETYDRSHVTTTVKKAETSAFDFWSKLPVVDANGNKSKPVTN